MKQTWQTKLHIVILSWILLSIQIYGVVHQIGHYHHGEIDCSSEGRNLERSWDTNDSTIESDEHECLLCRSFHKEQIYFDSKNSDSNTIAEYFDDVRFHFTIPSESSLPNKTRGSPKVSFNLT